MNFYADTPMWCMGPLWTVKTLDILVEAVDYSAKTYGTAYPVWKIRLYVDTTPHFISQPTDLKLKQHLLTTYGITSTLSDATREERMNVITALTIK